MSTSYIIKGTIRVIGATKQVSEKFSKREIVLDVEDGKYPQVVALEAHGDRCALLDTFRIGDEVSADCNLRGREWKSPSGEIKYFNTIVVWKIEATSKGAGAERRSAVPADAPPADDPLDQCPF